MRMPSHTQLSSFIFSAILTSALVPSNGAVALAAAGAPGAQLAVESVMNGLRAQGVAGSSLVLPPPVPSPSAAAAASPTPPGSLTPELLKKILQLIASRGVDQQIPADFANPLGL